MSNPSFENIDKWLFEYMEGNLSPAQVSQLEMFMLNNPEFEPDMDAWQLAKVDATPVVFPGVAGRKRKPVPFWLVSTLALTTVFVAGTFFGAYVNNPETEALLAESVARTQDYTLSSISNFETEFKAPLEGTPDTEARKIQVHIVSSFDNKETNKYFNNSRIEQVRLASENSSFTQGSAFSGISNSSLSSLLAFPQMEQ